MKSNQNASMFGVPVYSYTRKQALADGVLVDLTQFPISRTHWKMPIVCTAVVWSLIEQAVEGGADITGTLHDIYCIAKFHIIPGKSKDRLVFKCKVGLVTETFILHCGPADTAIAELTLMLPSDD
jgi:hypothetical protein